MRHTRRDVLAAGGASLAAATGGCLDALSGTGGSGDEVQASFYLLYDFARSVAGEEIGVDSVVPFGQHGHGWDGPTAGQQREIYNAELFVYMAEGFQPWADDVVTNVQGDDEDVEVVAVRDGVDLLPADGHDHDDDHDHADGDVDPHFWLDPSRTVRAVENVRDALIEVDPDNESAYREQAESSVAEIEALDQRVEEALADAERDAVLVAGHNAFRYLGDAYGFEVHALSGLSPDEEISAAAQTEAVELIEEHDIRHVLSPALESGQHAETLVADTDAEEVLEITAISGVTDEWLDDDWGYLELMDNVNLPSFTTALQA